MIDLKLIQVDHLIHDRNLIESYLLSNPYKPVKWNSFIIVYNPVDRMFYYHNPDNVKHKGWYLYRGFYWYDKR